MAGYYDKNKDYAAAIRNATSESEKNKLKQERQNKIDAMNASGTNTKGYTNDVYNNSSSSSKTNSSGSSSSSKKNNSSSSSSSGGSKNNSGYYDPNKDYAAAIKNATSDAERNQLIAERQNKIDAMNAAGTNTGGYTNDIYNGSSNSGSTAGGNNNSGYYDPGKDYAAAIAKETDPVKRAQLMQERQNKIDAMNAAGTNTGGYTNDIYGGNGAATSFGTQAEAPKGIWQNQDAMINNTALNTSQQAATNAALANMEQVNGALNINPASVVDYQQVLNNTTDPVQRAALQAYFTRMQSNTDPSEQQGVYAGDTSMSLPDQALLKTYQKNYNDAKARGDQEGMALAQRAAENLRDNYRYYPTANSTGYNMGENDLGWIRDVVVRVDSLGNKYVDEYGLNNVTTTKFNADGSQSYQTVNKIGQHDDYVARQMDRSAGYGNDWTAIRLADANDANLSAGDLMAKYGAQAGMGRDLYGDGRINGKIANGMTGAGTPIGQKGATGAVANNATGYFDPNKDYAAAIKNASSTQEMLQLQQERENKINWMNQNGQNPNGYTNQIYSNYQNIAQQSVPLTSQQAVQQAAVPTYQGMTKAELYDGYNDAAESLENQRNELLKLTLAQSQAAQDTANSDYDNMARQAYILKRQQEMALPQQLAAMGISGGGSETANLRLQANYQNNLNQNELARQQMLKDYALQNMAAQTQANSDIAGYYADAQQNAMNAWQNEMANQNAWNQWAASYQQGLREYQDQLNNLTYDQIQANKAQQIELAQLTGDYSKLKQMGYDTSYLEQMKDANLKQMALDALYTQAQTAKVNGSVNNGGSGGDDTGYLPKEDDEVEEIGNKVGSSWIYISGIGRVGDSELQTMIDNGTIKATTRNGKKYYVKA